MVKIGKTKYTIDATKCEDGLNILEISKGATTKTLIFNFGLGLWFLCSGVCGYQKPCSPEFV